MVRFHSPPPASRVSYTGAVTSFTPVRSQPSAPNCLLPACLPGSGPLLHVCRSGACAASDALGSRGCGAGAGGGHLRHSRAPRQRYPRRPGPRLPQPGRPHRPGRLHLRAQQCDQGSRDGHAPRRRLPGPLHSARTLQGQRAGLSCRAGALNRGEPGGRRRAEYRHFQRQPACGDAALQQGPGQLQWQGRRLPDPDPRHHLYGNRPPGHGRADRARQH